MSSDKIYIIGASTCAKALQKKLPDNQIVVMSQNTTRRVNQSFFVEAPRTISLETVLKQIDQKERQENQQQINRQVEKTGSGFSRIQDLFFKKSKSLASQPSNKVPEVPTKEPPTPKSSS